MKLSELVDKLSLDVGSGQQLLDQDITGAYVSDLLSDVMANAEEGNVWITLQTHMNIVAVASLKKMSGIIIVGNRRPPNDVIEKAESEHVPILLTSSPAFETAGRIYQLLY